MSLPRQVQACLRKEGARRYEEKCRSVRYLKLPLHKHLKAFTHRDIGQFRFTIRM